MADPMRGVVFGSRAREPMDRLNFGGARGDRGLPYGPRYRYRLVKWTNTKASPHHE